MHHAQAEDYVRFPCDFRYYSYRGIAFYNILFFYSSMSKLIIYQTKILKSCLSNVYINIDNTSPSSEIINCHLISWEFTSSILNFCPSSSSKHLITRSLQLSGTSGCVHTVVWVAAAVASDTCSRTIHIVLPSIYTSAASILGELSAFHNVYSSLSPSSAHMPGYRAKMVKG